MVTSSLCTVVIRLGNCSLKIKRNITADLSSMNETRLPIIITTTVGWFIGWYSGSGRGQLNIKRIIYPHDGHIIFGAPEC